MNSRPQQGRHATRWLLTIIAFAWVVVAARFSVGWLSGGGLALAVHPGAITIDLPAFYWIWASHLLAIGLPTLAVGFLIAKRIKPAALALGVLAANAVFGDLFVFGSPEWYRAMWPQELLCITTLAVVLISLRARERLAGAS
jgi:hypothetical protein